MLSLRSFLLAGQIFRSIAGWATVAVVVMAMVAAVAAYLDGLKWYWLLPTYAGILGLFAFSLLGLLYLWEFCSSRFGKYLENRAAAGRLRRLRDVDHKALPIAAITDIWAGQDATKWDWNYKLRLLKAAADQEKAEIVTGSRNPSNMHTELLLDDVIELLKTGQISKLNYVYTGSVPLVLTDNWPSDDEPTDQPEQLETLHDAALWAIYKSAWGKWQRKQYGSGGSEEHFLSTVMAMVAHIVMDAAVSGILEIQGRPPDAIEFQPISGATWRLAALSVVPDKFAIYKFEVIPRGVVVTTDEHGITSGAESDRIKDVLSYDSLIVNFKQFQSIFEQLGQDDGNR